MRLDATICFTEMYKSGDKEDRVGMQIANPNLAVKTEPLKKRMYQNPKSLLKEVFEHYDLTWLWIRVPFALRCTPSCELLVVEYSHGDKVFNGLLVASRFPPLLGHDSCFLLCITFRHDSSLAGERENGGGLIGGDFGCNRVGERKKKAAVANDNGVQ